MKKLMRTLALARRGATAIEYGLIAALIALTALGAIQLFANGAMGTWNSIKNAVVSSS